MAGMRAAVPLTCLALLACHPGEDGAWSSVEDDLLPAQLRTVRLSPDGFLWTGGYHEGSLSGILLQGGDGVLTAVRLPDDLLVDYAFADMDVVGDGAVWLAATAHLFRFEERVWDRWEVPDAVVDGVTACAFPEDLHGWIVGQGWDGPHIYRFEEDGTFTEEPIDGDVSDVSLASLEVLADGTGYAAGARMVDPQQAVVLVRQSEAWSAVELPADADEIGAVRDLAWHDGGPEIWVVADQVLRGTSAGFDVEEIPFTDDFIPRVGAFPANREGWIAGFGETPLYHWRYGVWEAVPPARLAPGADEDATRTWLFDDAHFPEPEEGWLVGTFLECDEAGACHTGESLLRFDRLDDTASWTVDSTWAAPPDDADTGPALAPSALAVTMDGSLWIAGDAAPTGTGSFGRPETWRRKDDGSWSLQAPLGGIGVHDLRFAGEADGWAVGSQVVDEDVLGAIVRWDGDTWEPDEVPEMLSTDWELYAVEPGYDGVAWAVGRSHEMPLALARVDGLWGRVDVESWSGLTSLLDVTVEDDGTAWIVGTQVGGDGSVRGVLLTGDTDGLAYVDVEDRECGPPEQRYACWGLAAVSRGQDRLVAAGESTLLDLEPGGQVSASTPTNMSLIAAAHGLGGDPFVLAENAWWDLEEDGWVVHRHWDPQTDQGIVRRLTEASHHFEVVAGYREWTDDDGTPQIQSILLYPEP